MRYKQATTEHLNQMIAITENIATKDRELS
jgi:hypothetical protein